MPKNPTLRDIARIAEVSVSTVSLVLNNKSNVKPEMREHVLKVATSLGYRQKVVSNSPLSGRLSTVGLLTKRRQKDQLISNPFYSTVIDGVERECQRHNINLMYANVEVDERNRTLNWPAMLLNDLVDGVIVVGTFLEETLADISRRTAHNIVLVDSYSAEENQFDTVVMDNFGGAISAVNHLIANGHQHIGLIGSDADSYRSVLERRQGYLAALTQNHIPHAYIEDGLLERPDAYQATLRLLRRAPHLTAIFACNDETAMGVMSAVRKVGYRVPQDISVIGFDDIDLAQEVEPPLTTIHVDKVLMGSVAMRLLRDRADDPDRSAIKTVIRTHLISRGSVWRLGLET